MEINLQQIEQANKRVLAALNRRYEKNAELYISKQDVDSIKQWLYDGQFSYIYSKFKAENIHPDIYFLTILNNSWLIQSINQKQFSEFLMPILRQVHPRFVKDYLKLVADRKIDMPDLLRLEFVKYYTKTLTVEEVQVILVNNEPIGVVRRRLLVARVLEQYVGTPQFIAKLEQYKEEYPEIKADNFFLKSLTVPQSMQRKHMNILIDWIHGLATSTQVSQFILNSLQFDYELLYEYAIEQAKQQEKDREKQKIWFRQIAVAANRLMKPKTADVRRKQMIKEIIQLYVYLVEHYPDESAYYIRYCLKRIEHPEFREQLNLFFTPQRIQQVDNRFKQDLQDALTGNNSGKITSLPQLVKGIDQNAWSHRYVHFLAFQFIDMRPKAAEWCYLFNELTYGSNRISTFVETVLKLAGDRAEIWTSYFEAVKAEKQQECYAMNVILQNAPKNKIAKNYLEQQNYQKYSELYRV